MIRYRPPRYLFRRHEIMRHLKPGRSFLEIGPGSFELCQELVRLFDHGTAMDYNEKVFSRFIKLPIESQNKINLIIGEFMEAEIQTSFDCIVACEVLEHIENDVLFLKKTHKILDTGGQIILSVPARMKYFSVHDEIVGHLRRYEKIELENKIKNAGFNKVKIISYGYPFINLLKIPRIFLAKLQYSQKKDWDLIQKIKGSGFSQIDFFSKMKFMGIITNKYFFYPFCLFASLFNSYDLSDGYIAIAYKSKDSS